MYTHTTLYEHFVRKPDSFTLSDPLGFKGSLFNIWKYNDKCRVAFISNYVI